MKKKIKLVLLCFAFLLCGCQKKDVSNIIVLSNEVEDKGLVLVCSSDNKVIKEIEVEYPNMAYYQDNIIYIYNDNYYIGYDTTNGKKVKEIETNDALIYLCDNGYYFVYDDLSLNLCGEEKVMHESYEISVVDYINDDKNFYVLDSIGTLRVFDKKDGSLVNKTYVKYTSDLLFSMIEQQIYLINYLGITRIVDYEVEMTYLFDINCDYLSDCRGNIAYFMVDDISIPYQISFSEYSVELELLAEEKYTALVDYEEQYKDYYDLDYSCVYDFEVND